MQRFVIGIALIVVASCTDSCSRPADSISVRQLMASPGSFVGRDVRIACVFAGELDHSWICDGIPERPENTESIDLLLDSTILHEDPVMIRLGHAFDEVVKKLKTENPAAVWSICYARVEILGKIVENPGRGEYSFAPSRLLRFADVGANVCGLGATASGERLNVTSLVPGEEIVVRHYYGGDRSLPRAHEFRIGGAQPRQFVARSLKVDASCCPRTRRVDRKVVSRLLACEIDRPLTTRVLNDREAQGLDATISYFRRVREEKSSAADYYTLSYLRSGELIGEEVFVGFFVASQLNYLAIAGLQAESDYDPHAALAARWDIERKELDRMITFEMLEKAVPNQPPEATPDQRPPSTPSPSSGAPQL
jgi:hypothetical protein